MSKSELKRLEIQRGGDMNSYALKEKDNRIAELERKLAEQQAVIRRLREEYCFNPDGCTEELNKLLAAAKEEGRKEAVPEGHLVVPIEVLKAASDAIGNFVSEHGWAMSDMSAMDNLDAVIAAAPKPQGE